MKKRILIAAAAILTLTIGTIVYVRAQPRTTDPTPPVVQSETPEPTPPPESAPVEPESIEEVKAVEVVEAEPVEVATPKTPEQHLVDTVRSHAIAMGWDNRPEINVLWGGSETQVLCARDRMRLWGGYTQENVDRFLDGYINPTIMDLNGAPTYRYFQFSGAGTCSTYYDYRPV